MSRKLENYITDHKKEFETEVPSEQLWKRIESNLNIEKTKKHRRLSLWLSAAASLIVITTLMFVYTYHKSEKEKLDIANASKLYANKEMKFANLIEVKKDSLEIFADKNPELYARFNTDLDKLGKQYQVLKKELNNSPNQRAVAKAMVKNLELQLQVINQQLSIIIKVDEYKRENQI